MQSISIADTAIHFRYVPPVGGRPVIAFINSLGTDFRIWDSVVEALTPGQGYLLYDKRGHGLSGLGQTPYSISALAGDLAALMDVLEVSDAVICGVSVGGQIAQELYHQRPDLVSGLLLCDTAARIGEPDFWLQRIRSITHTGLPAAADGIMERWFSPEFRADGGARYAVARAMFERQPVEGYLATCAAISEFDRRADAGAIDVPTSVIVGSVDRATPPEVVRAFAETIAVADFQIIDGAGHLPCIEKPEAVAAALAALLVRVQQRSERDDAD